MRDQEKKGRYYRLHIHLLTMMLAFERYHFVRY